MEVEHSVKAPPSAEPKCRCFKCHCVLDDYNGVTVETCIPCSRRNCDTWSCFKCAGFESVAAMNAHKGVWYCCSKKRKGKSATADGMKKRLRDVVKRHAKNTDPAIQAIITDIRKICN